ncbi:MAG: amidohydrolase family protein [Candidatus Aminicenantes bacterium]|nr:amidohydrolase family protein [Candidatus Aminicenantes bacterium]
MLPADPSGMSYHADFHRKITSHPETAPIVPVIDAHLHFVDFIQDTDGIKKLIAAMDAGRVAKAVLFGLPLKKKWDAFEKHAPHYYLDDNSRCYYFHQTDEIVAEAYLDLPVPARRRLAPLVCGFNPTDKYAARDIERMLNKYSFWRGIGEILCRHDDLTNLTNEETARVNHPALFDVYALCAARRLPVLIHQNSTSVSIHDEYEHLDELEEMLQKFPETVFVWAHCGISRRVFHKNYHEMVSALLDRYPNAHVDISWVVYDDVICDMLQPKKHWLDTINRYPTRFSLGSDLCGHFEHLGRSLARYNGLLRSLSPRVRRLVSSENAERLWFRRGARRVGRARG